MLPGLLYPATQYIEALNLREKVLQDLSAAVFTDADLLHLPVIPFPVPTIEESDIAANPGFSDYVLQFGHCTRPINFLGLPAITVPIGTTRNGLPCAMQLVGRSFDEALLFRAAHAYERETGWVDRAPALS